MFLIGQGLYGKIRFVDGVFPAYDRTYLVVETYADKIGVLNVSSVKGKEYKLLFPTNKLINKHYPPFLLKSFVKVDSLVHVPNAEASKMLLLDNGNLLDSAELSKIIRDAGLTK